MTTAVIGLVALLLLVTVGIHLVRRIAQANERINADIAFLRAIPGDLE